MKTIPDSATGGPPSTTLVVLLHDHHGSVERVLGATRRQGCVLVNLALEPAEQAGLARVSLTIAGGQPARLAQQLARLVDVVEVRDATGVNVGRSPADSSLAPTPFHSQADGASPREGDSASPETLMED